MTIPQDIRYVGVNDHQIDLFEGQYIVPNGMAYNSYVILDQKTAVIDSVDARFGEAWLGNVRAALDGRMADYLIVQHMEPDHSANIDAFMQAYPQAVVVATQKAFPMMKQFFGTDYADRRMIVSDGAKLSLGRHELTFFTAPMVHWPEVMMTWDKQDKVLFSADAFGRFGALDASKDWTCEARRYYFGIVGKFGTSVRMLLRKIAGLPIQTICPLHGPALSGNLGYYLDKYNTWSSYGAEDDGVVIACASIYGNTMKAAQLLADTLRAKGCPKVALHDLARCDMAEAIEDAFRHGTLVLAASSYNGGVFPFMKHFIDHLTERNYQNRKIALIENGSWAPTAGKTMVRLLEGSKNLTFVGTTVTIRSALDDDSRAAIAALADALCAN